MNRFLTKIISLILIFNLLFVGGFFPVGQVFAQSDPAPTSAPKAESVSSPPKPPSETKPVAAEQPTSIPSQSNNSTSPTTIPQPTNKPEPTVIISASNPTPTDSVNNPSADTANKNSSPDQQNGEIDSSSDKTANGSVNDPANIKTGPFSNNFASEVNKKTEEIVNNNLAKLQNKIDAISSTGFNYSNLNTLQGQVNSGDSFASLNLLNKLNSNVTGLGGFSVYNIYDTQLGDLIFKFADGSPVDAFTTASSTVSKNADTGPGSTNNAIADNSFKVKEANGNDAQIVNDINLEAVSGENSASYNTGGGSVKTGDSTALGNIVNLANTNLNVDKWLFGVVNIFGTLAGNIVLPQDTSNNSNQTGAPVFAGNTNTGPLSTNNATYNDSATSNYTNNNTADIETSLNVTANTGNNIANVNTGGGSVKTGSSDASVSNSTIANSNTINEEGTVWMVIVNEMGKWVGHIIGSPWGSTVASNALPITQTGGGAGTQTYSTVSQNSGTGPGSTNNAVYNNTSDTSVENNNKAAISNNITANADTGNNDASYNTGAGQVETGNAKTGLNLVNMVNTNVVAKKFVAILVNVMGNFLGDVVTPEQKYANQTANANNNYDSTENSTKSQLTPSQPPLPTVTPYQAPQFTASSSNIGGISSTDDMATLLQSDQNTGNNESEIAGNYSNSQNQYIASVNRVNYKKVQTKRTAQSYIQGTPIKSGVNGVLKRGVFVSPAFAKATETSFAGMLLGGATFKVNETWLSIIPVAFIILALRRRKKFEFGKYMNALLEIIL